MLNVCISLTTLVDSICRQNLNPGRSNFMYLTKTPSCDVLFLEGCAGSCRVVMPVHFTATGCSRSQSADCHVELREELQPSQLTVLSAVTNFTSRTVWETLRESRHRNFFFYFLNCPDSVRQLSYWSVSNSLTVCCNLAYISRSSVRSHRIRHRCSTSWTGRHSA